MINSFRDLTVWQKSMDLVIQVYRVTEKMPTTEKYGLTSQVRRATVSIPSNIAEGKAVGGRGYARHVKVALGSEAEVQTQIEIARRLGMLSNSEVRELAEAASEVGRMLAGLYRALPNKKKKKKTQTN